MTNYTRAHLNLNDQDVEHLDAIQDTFRVSKSTAIRHGLRVAALIATGKAGLVNEKGKPIEIIPS
jgi:hypothetical protein